MRTRCWVAAIRGRSKYRKRRPRATTCACGSRDLVYAPRTMARARRLTHLDRRGRARMVDVSPKRITAREAVARGEVTMRPATLVRIAAGTLPKGDVLGVARLAG